MFEPAITLTFNDKNKQAVYQKLLSFNLPAMRDEIRLIFDVKLLVIVQ